MAKDSGRPLATPRDLAFQLLHVTVDSAMVLGAIWLIPGRVWSVVVAAILAIPGLLLGLLAISSWVNQRQLGRAGVSRWVPDSTYYPANDFSPLTIVAAGDYKGDARVTFALDTDSKTLQGPSMLAPFDRFNLLILNYSRFGAVWRDWVYSQLLDGLSGRVVLVGYRYGGIFLSDFHDWYYSLPLTKQHLGSLELVMFSPPVRLKKHVRLFLQILRYYSGGPVFMWVLPYIARAFVSRRDVKRLREKDVENARELLLGSARYSAAMLANLRDIAAGSAFSGAKDASDVVVINFSQEADKYVDVAVSVRAIREHYPKVKSFIMKGPRTSPEIDGAKYARSLKRVLSDLGYM